MDTVIVGAGAAGLTTAHALVAAGHRVTVIEAAQGPCRRASFGSAGFAGPGVVRPLGEPMAGFAGKLAARLHGTKSLPYTFRQVREAASFMGRWIGQRDPQAWQENRRRLALLAAESLEESRRLAGKLGVNLQEKPGLLHFFATAGERAALLSRPVMACEAAAENPRIDSGIDQLEPALGPGNPIGAALLQKDCTVANINVLAKAVASDLSARGLPFLWGTSVTRLAPRGGKIAVTAGGQERFFDAAIVCAGAGSAALLAQAGIRLPLASASGFVANAALRETDVIALHNVYDHGQGISITRLGNRMRVCGLRRLGPAGGPAEEKQARTALIQAARLLMPQAALWNEAFCWSDTVAVLPDSLPAVGSTKIPGLFVNTGAGFWGLALAAACARHTAQALSGTGQPAETAQWLRPDRF